MPFTNTIASQRLLAGLFIAVIGLLASPVSAQEPMPTPEQMWRELQALRAEVTELRDDHAGNWLNERRAEEVKALIHEVLSDADTRASLLADGITAGHDGGNFYLASADGGYLLKIGGQIQLRYIANSRDDDAAGSVDDFESGFQIRRVKLSFSGHIADPRLQYAVQLAANRDSGVVELEDAWIAYQATDAVRIWAGRFQDYFAREQMMSSRRQVAVDRTAVANVVAGNDGYVEGAGVEWKAAPEYLKLAVTVNDGLNSGLPGGAGPGFLNRGNDFHNDATDIAFTARADVKLAGDWAQAADASAWSDAPGPHVLLGAAMHYELGETGDSQAAAMTMQVGPYDSFVLWTLDALVKCHGFAVMGAVYGWHFDAADGNPFGNTDHYAATVQLAGMVVPDRLEPFIRYEWLGPDDALSTNDLHIIALGFNYYFKKHNAKVTVDLLWSIENINATSTLGNGLTGIGLLPDAPGEDNQVVGRVQFQLLF